MRQLKQTSTQLLTAMKQANRPMSAKALASVIKVPHLDTARTLKNLTRYDPYVKPVKHTSPIEWTLTRAGNRKVKEITNYDLPGIPTISQVKKPTSKTQVGTRKWFDNTNPSYTHTIKPKQEQKTPAEVKSLEVCLWLNDEISIIKGNNNVRLTLAEALQVGNRLLSLIDQSK